MPENRDSIEELLQEMIAHQQAKVLKVAREIVSFSSDSTAQPHQNRKSGFPNLTFKAKDHSCSSQYMPVFRLSYGLTN